jgi:hypothetical protein
MQQDQQVIVSSEVLSGVASLSFPDPWERNPSISGSYTGTDPGIPNRTWRPLSLQVGPPRLPTILPCVPIIVLCPSLVVPVRRSSFQLPQGEARSSPPGRLLGNFSSRSRDGNISMPEFSSTRRQLATSGTCTPPPFFGIYFGLRVVLIGFCGTTSYDKSRADSFALCLELYDRASYYLSPAAMLWWVLARAQAAPGK